MVANFQPIYTVNPNVGGLGTTVTTAANTAFDGTGTTVTAFTAGANGAFVQKICFRAQGGSGNNNVATVARVFLNNGSSSATPTNNLFLDEITLPATTGSAVAALPPIDLPLNFYIPAGWKLNWCLGTAVATGYWTHVVGGDY